MKMILKLKSKKPSKLKIKKNSEKYKTKLTFYY